MEAKGNRWRERIKEGMGKIGTKAHGRGKEEREKENEGRRI